MSLYEDWMKKAFSQEGRSIEAVWEEYLPKEQKIYDLPLFATENADLPVFFPCRRAFAQPNAPEFFCCK